VIKYIPNVLTVFRIILTPVFLYLAIWGQSSAALVWAVIIFVVAALTDWLDGAIARKYKIISNFGKIWDPLADKFIVLAALGVLTWRSPFRLHWLIFVIIAVREVLVTVLRESYARRNIIMPADKWGKLKTLMQMLGIIFCLVCWAVGWLPVVAVSGARVWFWLVALVTLYSGINYLMVKRS
jgi:CDP-diacylglycerol--glycerol-3-phosphate 3-phosphatidyltransferase